MRSAAMAILTLALTGAASGEEPADERGSAERVVAAYHAALESGQPEKVLPLIGPTCFMADERTSGGMELLTPHLYLTGDALKAWPGNYLRQVGPHRNASRTVRFSSRRDAAVLVTRDTGGNAFRTWKDEEVAWLLGRTNGQWLIVGMVIRDIQLPEGK